MYLSELQQKDIISLNDGRKIGKIIDVEINEDGTINKLLVETSHTIRNIFKKEEDIKISFKDISKIGSDVILVNLWYNVQEVKNRWIEKFF